MWTALQPKGVAPEPRYKHSASLVYLSDPAQSVQTASLLPVASSKPYMLVFGGWDWDHAFKHLHLYSIGTRKGAGCITYCVHCDQSMLNEFACDSSELMHLFSIASLHILISLLHVDGVLLQRATNGV